jgi:altronate hydrolase
MDVHCGTILDGTESVAQAGARVFELLLRAPSGAETKSEQWGYGEDEFAPWVLGATM